MKSQAFYATNYNSLLQLKWWLGCMSLENSNGQIEFSVKERSKAEFWAWLTGCYAVSLDSTKRKAEHKITVLSKDAVKTAIRDALSKGDSVMAQELLDVASKPDEEASNTIIRKSIRVLPGEYVKLLYVKMQERSSFADVMMKILKDPCKEMVEQFKSQLKGQQSQALSRINHLSAVIASWEQEKPESRAQVAEWGDLSKPSSLRAQESQDGGTERANDWEELEHSIEVENASHMLITPFYSKPLLDQKRLDALEAAFCRLALTDLLIKAAGGDLTKPVNKLYYEFKDEWTKPLKDKSITDEITISAITQNNSENQEIFFNVYFQLYASFTAEQEMRLFSKYGEELVNEFVERVKLYQGATNYFLANGQYKGITNSDRWKNGQTSGDYIQIGTEIEFNCTKIIPASRADFARDSNWPSKLPEVLENNRQQFDSILCKVAEKIPFNDFHRKKSEYLDLACNADELIPKALDKASSPEDYREINNLLTLRNIYWDYRGIIEYVEEVVRSTLNHHSVVSFYVNSDLWRLVPLVLEQKNWAMLVDDYLKGKASVGQTERAQ
jgi:ribonucleotide reductase alpha subunit